jgi:hypothetical protein
MMPGAEPHWFEYARDDYGGMWRRARRGGVVGSWHRYVDNPLVDHSRPTLVVLPDPPPPSLIERLRRLLRR